MNLTWEARRLMSLSTNGTSVSYLYDIDGIRTRKTVGSAVTEYYRCGSTIIAEKTGDNVIWYLYDASGSPIGFTYNDTSYYYLKNIQGDVVSIVDADMNIVGGYTYDAWGKVLSVTGDMAQINPIRYRGYYYDVETGFYYLNSRYYDPETGRFINADNNFSNLNLFMYCANNSVNASDPDGGHWYYLWLDDLINAVDELMASVSNIVYGRAAIAQSFIDPKGAQDLWNSRPFQKTKPSQEMQIFAEAMYDYDFVADVSVSVSTPKNTYVKAGVSKVVSPSKNIDATYLHAGGGLSTPSVLPITITYSVGVVNGVSKKENYAGKFIDYGANCVYGLDYCYWPNGASAYSFSVGTSYGVYGGFDYYWCLD